MFFQADPCPLLSASDIHFCAVQGHDYRQRCTISEMMQSETILDASCFPCFERFENIKGCFWRWAQRRHQLAEISEIHESKMNCGRMTQLNIEQSPSPFTNYR
ncbi:hypothetical protein ACH3XW_41005 [Acanthocheilonema viteae]